MLLCGPILLGAYPKEPANAKRHMIGQGERVPVQLQVIEDRLLHEFGIDFLTILVGGRSL
jgi:hypothetical protein